MCSNKRRVLILFDLQQSFVKTAVAPPGGTVHDSFCMRNSAGFYDFNIKNKLIERNIG